MHTAAQLQLGRNCWNYHVLIYSGKANKPATLPAKVGVKCPPQLIGSDTSTYLRPQHPPPPPSLGLSTPLLLLLMPVPAVDTATVGAVGTTVCFHIIRKLESMHD